MNTPIVTTTWLAEHLNDENLRVIDLRGYVVPATEPPPHYFNKREDYDRGHIPGAVFVDWVREITDPDDPRHAQAAKPDRFAAVMSRAGVDADTLVVVYDDNGIFAARLWWMLNYYGHTNVVYLDGGWDKWVAEGHPTTDKIPDISPTIFIPDVNPVLRRTMDQVAAALNTDTVLVDVRSDKEYNGEASRAHRFGHIPGAVHNPRSTFMNDDKTLFSAEQIRIHFESIGITPDTPEVIVYCNGGVSASYTLLALNLAGYRNATLYDGSWKEWGGDDSKPIE